MSDTRVYDKTDTFHWSNSVNVDCFNHGDIIVGVDPQERLGDGTYSVAVIDRDLVDPIRQVGLFWLKAEAFRYAVAINDDPGFPGGGGDD